MRINIAPTGKPEQSPSKKTGSEIAMVVPAGTRRCTCLKKSCGISYRIQNFDKMINGKRSGSTQETHTNSPSFAYFNTREYCKSIRIKDKQQSTCAKRKISFFKSDLPAVHLIKYMQKYMKIFLDKEKVTVYNTKSMRKREVAIL